MSKVKTTLAPGNRPLSPFMIGPYYRPQLTSMLSITHRMTGLALVVGSLLLAGWLIALAGGPQTFERYARHIHAWYGQVLLFLWTYALFFHLCNGIRHLMWDMGKGLDIDNAYKSGYLVIAVSLVATVGIWAAAIVL